MWEKTKNFLSNARKSGDTLSADDAATYEKMEAEIVALGKEIDILERQEQMERTLNMPINTPIKNTPNGSSDSKIGKASNEYKQAFWNAMKNKYPYTAQDTLQIGSDSEGGYLVPDEFESTLIDKLAEENFIRNLATIITSSNGDKKIPVVASHGAAVWVDEGGEYTEDDDTFGIINLGAHKLSSIIKVSEELLNDSAFNIETYIAQEFARRMSAAEESAFISGDSVGKPTGLLTSGEIGVNAAGSNAITADEIIDLYHSLRTPYRKNGVFIANDSTIKAIRKLKDANGQYLWTPGLQSGQPDTILNRPIYTSAYMPEIGAGNKILMFGDMSYYWIADRQGRSFQRLNELFANKGQIGFRVLQRTDGKLTLPEAVKVMSMGG